MKIASWISTLTILLSVSSAAAAVERSHTGALKLVYPLANGDFVIAFNSSPSTCSSAANPKYLYVSVGQNSVTSAGSTKLYAAALTALTSGIEVSIAFDDATDSCYINRLTLQP